MKRFVPVLLSVVVPLVVAAIDPSPAFADDDATAVARAHYHKGTKAYDLGRYLEAAHEYEAAYEAKDDPSLLFNIAQAYRLGGDYPNALRSYKSYLRRVPDAENRPEIESRIAELQKSFDQQQRAKEGPPEGTIPPGGQKPETSPPTTSPAQTPFTPATASNASPHGDARLARRLKIAGLVVGGVGIAALAAGGAFTGLANEANRTIVRSDNTWSQSTEDRRNLYQTLDAVFFAVGGAAVATGTVLYLYGRHEQKRAANAEHASIAVGIAGPRAFVGGAF